MKFDNKKKAFTIAEIMVVILILTILFAAFAPLITKRRTTASKDVVWSWNGSGFSAGPMDAYFDPTDTKYTGTLFFGATPSSNANVRSAFLPYSRVIIRSGPVTSNKVVQRQIQFRYGRSSTADKGTYAGSWFMDGKNVLLGGDYKFGGAEATKIKAISNVGIGYGSLGALTSGKNNTALGMYSLGAVTTGTDNTALGYYAGSKISAGKNNTYVGSQAGLNGTGNNNTALGYRAGAGANGASGLQNIFIGAYAGENIQSGSYNTGIGYAALNKLQTGNYNVALGYLAMAKLTAGDNNTAIGYNACGELTKGSNKTCIGANSGPHASTTADKYLNTVSGNGGKVDDEERTYIGGKPYNFGGDAVMEIHNVGGSSPHLMNSPGITSNTTTVINGNLIVRGRSFFTVGSSLYGFHQGDVNGSGGHGAEDFGLYKGAGECINNQTGYSWTSKSYCPKLVTSSDRRLKNIGSKSTAGLKEINQLKVYNYNFINDKDKRPQVGVIAQELLKVFPNSVFEGDDGFLKIRWDEMFFASINAIKELDRKIVALVKRTTDVETQIAQLETENKELKTQVDNLALRVEKLKTK